MAVKSAMICARIDPTLKAEAEDIKNSDFR